MLGDRDRRCVIWKAPELGVAFISLILLIAGCMTTSRVDVLEYQSQILRQEINSLQQISNQNYYSLQNQITSLDSKIYLYTNEISKIKDEIGKIKQITDQFIVHSGGGITIVEGGGGEGKIRVSPSR